VIAHPPQDGLFDPTHYPTFAEARACLALKNDDKIVLFFGQIRPNKDLPSLLRAVAQVRHTQPNVRLLVAGQPLGSMRDVMSLIRQLGLASAVTLHLRYLPLHEVPNYFQAADVIALPYLTVTQSGVLALALAFDKPVVATHVGGLPELARFAGIGSLVPPQDSAALAESISAQLYSPSRATKQPNVLRWPEAARLTALLYSEALAAFAQN